MPIVYKDGISENTHPLNVVEVPDDFVTDVEPTDRPPLFEVYMRMAEELAKRSTCARLQVGTVLTDARLEHVVAIHSEMNALVKAPGNLRDKVAFVTASPCVMCAKLMVQAHVSHVFYREAYRDPAGLDVLERAGVTVVHYRRWKDRWREGG